MPSLIPTSWLAAKPVLEPFPGWQLGSEQSADCVARLRKEIWRLVRPPFEDEWPDGLRLTLYPGSEICASIFVTGRYEPNEFCVLSSILKPGMTFIDAGANMGLCTLFAARRLTEKGA